MTTQNWNFDERNQDQSIEYAGSAKAICQGCKVDLEQDGVRITVQVENNEGSAWTGQITAFPNNTDDTEIGELKIGNTINFEERHIFRCAA